MRNEVAGQNNKVWVEGLRHSQGSLNSRRVHVGAEVNVADLGNAKTLERLCQMGKMHRYVLGDWMVRLESESVDRGCARQRG